MAGSWWVGLLDLATRRICECTSASRLRRSGGRELTSEQFLQRRGDRRQHHRSRQPRYVPLIVSRRWSRNAPRLNATCALPTDTGSADLWIRTSACQTSQCTQSNAGPPYDDSTTFQPSGGDVDLVFGDSVTGTHASGPVGRDTVTLAGLVMEEQPLAAVNDTDNSAVVSGGSGILGLGFFSQR